MTEALDDYIRRAFAYDPKTGSLTNRIKRQQWPAGCEAGTRTPGKRRVVRVRSKHMLVARVAWFLMTGSWPTKTVDHINRDFSDDRWKNLRLATVQQQQQNKDIQSNNTTGYCGLSPTASGKWGAHISIDRRRHWLGSFTTKEAASAAYQAASKKLRGEFHPGEQVLGRKK